MKPIAFIAGIAYIIYRVVANKSSEITEKIPESDLGGPGSKIATSDDMIVDVDIEVSGLEKIKATPEYVKKHVMPAVLKAGELICEHAPILLGINPTIEVRHNHIGYKLTVKWPARWSGTRAGDVKGSVRDCFYKGILAFLDPDYRPRIKNFRIYRV